MSVPTNDYEQKALGTWLGFEALLDSDTSTDLILSTDGLNFRCHQSVVCLLSPVVATEVRAQRSEGQSKQVTIRRHGASSVRRVRQFCYMRQYFTGLLPAERDEMYGMAEEVCGLLVQARVAAAAAYYDMTDLETRAVATFDNHARDLRTIGAGFERVISAAYTFTTTKESKLKRSVLRLAIQHWHDLKESQSFLSSVQSIGSFLFEVLVEREAEISELSK